MNEAMLKRWATDSLSEAEKRTLYRWMVLNTDGDLPALLSGILNEQRENALDRSLRAVGAFWENLVDTWNTLLEHGQASWSSGAFAVPASHSLQPAAPQMFIEQRQSGYALVISGADRNTTRVFLSTDLPSVEEVAVNEDEHGDLVVPLHSYVSHRPTVWVFLNAPPATQKGAPQELTELFNNDQVEKRALRWTD